MKLTVLAAPGDQMCDLQVLARNGRAAVTIVQEGALPALAKTAGEGLSDRAQVNATKVRSCSIMPVLCKQCGLLICSMDDVLCRECHMLAVFAFFWTARAEHYVPAPSIDSVLHLIYIL